MVSGLYKGWCGVSEEEEPGWEVEPDDEWGLAVLATVGRQLKLRREAVGMRVADFAKAIGYGEDLVCKVESGKRIPRPEYLDKADEVLGAGGLLAAMKEDVEKVQYPKKVRDLAEVEGKAVELGVYVGLSIHGLLQTPEHAEALFEVSQSAYSEAELKRLVAARMARKAIFKRSPAPALSFVQEEVTLRRQVGGTMVWRQQLEHLLDVAQLRNVTLQVMPTDSGRPSGAQRQDRGAEVRRRNGGGALRRGRSTAVPPPTRSSSASLSCGTAPSGHRRSLHGSRWPLIEHLLGET